MSEIISKTESEISKLNSTPGGTHLRTGEIRKLSSRLFGELEDKSRENVFRVCEEFLEKQSCPMRVIAFDFAYRIRKQYGENTFRVFEKWLTEYVRGWGDCDDFCTHAFGELIVQDTSLVKNIIPWTVREEFWMRRAAAVVLIPSIRRNKYKETNPILISYLLMKDPDPLVLKGYGWMLKVLSTKEPELVYDYLKKNRYIMPRVSFRYALEELDDKRKKELMS